MSADKTVLYFGSHGSGPSELVSGFARENGLEVVPVDRPEDVRALLNRTFPACLVLDLEGDPSEILELTKTLKHDAFTAIVPLVVLAPQENEALAGDCLAVGADEVIHRGLPQREQELRLEQVLARAERDVSVHPTTRLPGVMTG